MIENTSIPVSINSSASPYLPFAQVNLSIDQVSSGFSHFLGESVRFYESFPEVGRLIDADLDSHGLSKKRDRIDTAQFALQSGGESFPFAVDSDAAPVRDLALEQGRPRTPTLLVFVFSQIRGYLGGTHDSKVWDFCMESLSLRHLLDTLNVGLPGRTTVLENLNAIRPESLQAIHAMQLRFIQGEIGATKEPARVCIDSTSVHSAGAFPVDSKLVRRTVDALLERMLECEANKSHRKPSCKLLRWVRQIAEIDRAIGFLRKGRKGAKTKRRQLYVKMVDRGLRAFGQLHALWLCVYGEWADKRHACPPVVRRSIEAQD